MKVQSARSYYFQHLVLRVNVLFVIVVSKEKKTKKHCFKGYITTKRYQISHKTNELSVCKFEGEAKNDRLRPLISMCSFIRGQLPKPAAKTCLNDLRLESTHSSSTKLPLTKKQWLKVKLPYLQKPEWLHDRRIVVTFLAAAGRLSLFQSVQCHGALSPEIKRPRHRAYAQYGVKLCLHSTKIPTGHDAAGVRDQN